MLKLLLQGILVGFSIAMPVGPIGILCIQRTLIQGRLIGFITGLGAAFADTFYGSIAAFGLTFITDFLRNQQMWVRIFGGIFLLFWGILTIFKKNVDTTKTMTQQSSKIGTFTSAFFLTFTNPMTILIYVGVFSWLSGDHEYISSPYILISGIFIGSATWFLTLSSLVGLLRNKLIPILKWINIISGVLIIQFSILTFLSMCI